MDELDTSRTVHYYVPNATNTYGRRRRGRPRSPSDETTTRESVTGEGAGVVSIDPAVLELDHVFAVLSHPRRRYLMYALATNPSWTLSELSTKLVAWEENVEEAAVDPHRREQMYISLYHTHVPKLEDAGVVEFEPRSETIARGNNATQVFAVLAGAGGSLDDAQEEHAGRTYSSDSEEEST